MKSVFVSVLVIPPMSPLPVVFVPVTPLLLLIFVIAAVSVMMFMVCVASITSVISGRCSAAVAASVWGLAAPAPSRGGVSVS